MKRIFADASLIVLLSSAVFGQIPTFDVADVPVSTPAANSLMRGMVSFRDIPDLDGKDGRLRGDLQMKKDMQNGSCFWSTLLVSAAALGTLAGTAVLAEHSSPPSAAAMQARFAAASIKPSNIAPGTPRRACRGSDTVPDPQRAQVQVPLGRCTFERARLDVLIVAAYSDELSWIRTQPPKSVVLGGPDWVHSDLFDVEAIADNPTVVNVGDLHQMLQGLLADRFKLKLHRESRESSGYVLVTANKGSKLVSSRDKTVSGRDRIRRAAAAPPGAIALSARNASMGSLSELLTTMGIGLVIDQTNLQGTYDFSLTFAEEIAVPGKDRPPPTAQNTDAPSIFTALREQLGLQLLSRKVSAEYLVIDSVERPSSN